MPFCLASLHGFFESTLLAAQAVRSKHLARHFSSDTGDLTVAKYLVEHDADTHAQNKVPVLRLGPVCLLWVTFLLDENMDATVCIGQRRQGHLALVEYPARSWAWA